MQPGAAREGHLPPQRIRLVEPVMPKVPRNARLVMPGEARDGALQVGPFGEAAPPPSVVLRHRMELREVEGEQLGPQRHALRQGGGFLERRAGGGGAAHLAGDIGHIRGHTLPFARDQQVEQRVGLVQPAAAVATQVEPGMGQAILAEALDQIMLQRVHAGGCDVRVGAQIELAVEFRDRAEVAAETPLQEMREAKLPWRHVIARPVPGRVEERDRAPSRSLPLFDVMEQGIAVSVAARQLAAVIGRVEIGVRPPIFAPTMPMPMDEGAMRVARQVWIAHAHPSAVEQSGFLQQHQPGPLDPVADREIDGAGGRHGSRGWLGVHSPMHRVKSRRAKMLWLDRRIYNSLLMAA